MEQEIAYLFDGSLEGLLSAVFLAYERHEEPTEITRANEWQPRFGQAFLEVPADFDCALRVKRGVERAAGRHAFTAIMRASTCEDRQTGTVVYRFIRHVMERTAADRKKPVLEDLANPIVSDLVRLARHASNETERMRQFVRFNHLENGVWFARCNPNANVVPLVMGYFAARLNDQPFIIYDERHHVAGIYDGRRWSLVSGDAVNVAPATANDALMEEAWKRFYDVLSIDARYNPELRRSFMPVRLWRNLPEMQPRCDTISPRLATVAQR